MKCCCIKGCEFEAEYGCLGMCRYCYTVYDGSDPDRVPGCCPLGAVSPLPKRPEPTQRELAEMDARIYGMGFLVDGVHTHPDRVHILRYDWSARPQVMIEELPDLTDTGSWLVQRHADDCYCRSGQALCSCGLTGPVKSVKVKVEERTVLNECEHFDRAGGYCIEGKDCTCEPVKVTVVKEEAYEGPSLACMRPVKAGINDTTLSPLVEEKLEPMPESETLDTHWRYDSSARSGWEACGPEECNWHASCLNKRASDPTHADWEGRCSNGHVHRTVDVGTHCECGMTILYDRAKD